MKKWLLVVDDDAPVRESLKHVLEQMGYDADVAADGAEAQTMMMQRKPDLLILDLNMPQRDGWDVLEDANALDPLMPVIIVTGKADQLATYQIPGARALMIKPVDTQQLLEEIERLLAEPAEARAGRASDASKMDSRAQQPSWPPPATGTAVFPSGHATNIIQPNKTAL